MKTLLESKNWEGKKDHTLATQLSLRGIEAYEDFVVDGLQFKMDAMQFDQIVLKAVSGKSIPGAPGFLRSLNLGKASYKGLTLSGVPKEASSPATSLSVDSYTVDGLSFTDGFILGDDSLLDILFAARANSVDWSTVKMEISTSESEKLAFSLANASIKNLQGFAKFESFFLKDLTLDSTSNNAGIKNSNVKLGELNLKNLDMREVYKDLFMGVNGTLLLQGEYDEEEKIDDNIDNFAKTSFLFAYPYDLDSWNLSDLDVMVNGIVFGIKNLDYQGPVKRNQVPSSKISIQDMTLDLRDVSYLSSESASDIKEFTDSFGMTAFNINGSVNITYDQESGNLKYQSDTWNVDSLFSLKFDAELTGLGKEFIDVLSTIPLKQFYALILLPETSSFGISSVNLEYTDQTLLQKLIKYQAQKAGITEDERKRIIQSDLIDSLEAVIGYEYKNDFFNTYAQYVGDFMLDPKSVSININPTKPVTMIDMIMLSKAQKDNVIDFVDSLNISFAVNGEEPGVVKFLQDE
jgi:hypothetical protein